MADPTVPGAAGALLFSCLGRGKNLYGRPDHDTDLFRDKVGDVPLGGFFANGEIGAVHGVTHLHGFTSSFALFRDLGPAGPVRPLSPGGPGGTRVSARSPPCSKRRHTAGRPPARPPRHPP